MVGEMGARAEVAVMRRERSATPRPDPYRRLPGVVFRLLRADSPAEVHRAVEETLPLLVPHDTLNVRAADEDDVRRALRGDTAPRRPAASGEVPRNPVAVPLVAHGVLFGELEVGRFGGPPFDEREIEVLGAFSELAALALHKAHAAAELAQQALTDPLTGLANRRGLTRALAATEGERHALLLLDLDGLKEVNDELGYEAGDAVIRASADALRTLLRDGELGARLGGDEFVALLGEDAGPRGDELTRTIETLPLSAEIRGRFRGGSVGVVEPRPGEGADALLRRAATEMRERKRARKDRAGAGVSRSAGR
jgi:diguanylate cyclase (GGDEF)-like protein